MTSLILVNRTAREQYGDAAVYLRRQSVLQKKIKMKCEEGKRMLVEDLIKQSISVKEKILHAGLHIFKSLEYPRREEDSENFSRVT